MDPSQVLTEYLDLWPERPGQFKAAAEGTLNRKRVFETQGGRWGFFALCPLLLVTLSLAPFLEDVFWTETWTLYACV